MRRKGAAVRGRGQEGSILLETLLAMFMMTVAGLSLLALIQKGTAAAFKAREQTTCARMVEVGVARLKNMDFYSLLAADSQSANYGLQAAYSHRAVLDGIKAALASSRFDRFRVQVSFVRRDGSDANGNGLASDLIAFSDGNGDRVDDYDPNIRYNDQNLDGDTYDTYASGGRIVAEEPDTHLKQVSFDVFRLGRLVCSRTELVSLEQFTGSPNPSSEAALALMVSTPANNATLYRALTAEQVSSRGLVIDKPYPAEVVQLRADGESPLLASGETDPLATVNLYVGGSGILDSVAADMAGTFSLLAANLTAALVEGANLLTAQAVKATYTSPITPRTLLLDFGLPRVSSAVPSGTAATLAPYVAASVFDLGVGTTVTSGICPDVITLKVNGATVNHRYDSTLGTVVWIDPATNTVPVLSAGVYTAQVQAGDYAGYKTTHSWSFTLSVADTDNSAPAVANKSPIGTSPSQLPVISARVFDNQSGINPLGIQMKLDGIVVVGPATIGSAYDPAAETVSYTPPAALVPGSSHTVEIRASHFATNPPDKIESVDTWSFTVP